MSLVDLIGPQEEPAQDSCLISRDFKSVHLEKHTMPGVDTRTSRDDRGKDGREMNKALFSKRPVVTEEQVDTKLNPRRLRQKFMFGTIVGFSSGVTFSAIDTFRNPTSVQVATRAAASSAGLFAGFFSLYQSLKYTMEVARGTEDVANIAAATALSMLPFCRSSLFRPNAPFMLMLVGMDYFHEEMNEKV